MATAEIITIADALLFELNTGGRWSQTFTAQRLYLSEDNLDDLGDDLHVTVQTKGLGRETVTRGKSQMEYAVLVQVQKRLSPNSDDPKALSVQDQCDQYTLFMQEMADWFDPEGGRPLTQYTGASVIGIANDPAYDQAGLQESVFDSKLVIGFRTWRAKRR